MSNTGFQLLASRIPGERLATAVRTSSPATFTTTETATDSVMAPLVNGRTYRVSWWAQASSSVTTDTVRARLRQDSVSGGQIQISNVSMSAGGATAVMLEAEYTATATGDKTFVATMVRQSGTGNITAFAAGSSPTYLYVDYIRG